MDRGAWWAIVHSIAKSRTQLKRLSIHYLKVYLYFSVLLSWVATLATYNRSGTECNLPND